MLNENSRRELRMQERAMFPLLAKQDGVIHDLQMEYSARVPVSGTTQPLWGVLNGTLAEGTYWLEEVRQEPGEGVYITPSRGGIPARVTVRVFDILCFRTGLITRQYFAEMPCYRVGVFPSASAMLLGIYSQYVPVGYDFCDREVYESVWGAQND